MRGRYVSLSPARRLVSDYMWFSRDLPLVTVERRVSVPELVAARAGLSERPAWAAVFIKAFAMVCAEDPRLRRAYVKLPWPMFFEYERPVASLVLEREYEGEDTLLTGVLRAPETLDVMDITRRVKKLAQAPVNEIRGFDRMLRISRLPRPLRRLIWWLGLNLARQRANYFGTFLITSLMSEGGISKRILAPMPVILTYGIFDEDGCIELRLTFDHRVIDGRAAVTALARLEEMLRGPVTDEITTGAAQA